MQRDNRESVIRLWFDMWNRPVVRWEIRQFFHSGSQTAAEWSFKDQMLDGRVEELDGISLVQWTSEGQILRLQEFGCNPRHYDPY